MRFFRFKLFSLIVAGSFLPAAAQPAPNFRSVVEKKLKESHLTLAEVCSIDKDPAARRIFAEYGAIFVSASNNPPPSKCIFDNDDEVAAFRSTVASETQNI